MCLIYTYTYTYIRAYVLHCFSYVWLFATLWTVAHQAPLSMEFLGKNTGMGYHALLQGLFPSQRPNSRLLCLLHLLHWRLSFYHWATGEAMYICVYIYIMFYVIFYIQYRCSWTIESHWTTEEDPTQGAPLSDWCTNLQHRTLARGVPLCAWHRGK